MRRELRKKFEAEVDAAKTPLSYILAMCDFDENCNDYGSDTVHDYSIGCLNGAWWMFQKQQSKVDELQKRVDAVKQLIQEYRDPPTEDKTFCHALSIVADELEQALKGGGE